MGAAERKRGRHTHTQTHTQMSDSGVELGAPNVDLMTGLYELKRSAEDEGEKKKAEHQKLWCVAVEVVAYPRFLSDKP